MGVVTGLVAALFLVGGLANRVESWKTDASREFITNHLVGVMGLDEEQKAKLAPIVREALEERWELRQEYRVATDRLFVEKYGPRVREILTEEQETKLKKRWGKWRRDNGLDPETGEARE